MFTAALFGSGKIGEAITALLASSGRYSVKVCDCNINTAKQLAQRWPNCSAHQLNLDDRQDVKNILTGAAVVISALPFSCNRVVAELAAECGVHYADLTEDVKTSQFVLSLASNSRSWFMPQCGLAPGFVSIAAAHLTTLFDSVDTLKLRVGALPMYPTNKLKYSITWSTVGLINEYCNPCEVIKDGAITLVPPMQGQEIFSLDGDEYEAFNTSGGLGSLCHSLHGKVRQLGYKTIRYVGHRDLMSFLLHELRFTDNREQLREILERSLPTTTQDKCIILVEATGTSHGKNVQKTYASSVYNQSISGVHFGAIQVTTAAGICGAVDLMLTGALGTKTGFQRVEDIPLKQFLANEFGKYYLDEKALRDL
jgi:saccharopine dehydrogenase-like NADP-dependent oxidoreductase